MEGDGAYRADEYFEGDGGLGCVYLPDASEYGAPDGCLGGGSAPARDEVRAVFVSQSVPGPDNRKGDAVRQRFPP